MHCCASYRVDLATKKWPALILLNLLCRVLLFLTWKNKTRYSKAIQVLMRWPTQTQINLQKEKLRIPCTVLTKLRMAYLRYTNNALQWHFPMHNVDQKQCSSINVHEVCFMFSDVWVNVWNVESKRVTFF
jgi:hypothetical protein